MYSLFKREDDMLATHSSVQETRLLSYVIASGDMRHIPVNEREVFLRRQPDGRLVIRGEVPECGADCHVNLSQILFEYAISCEDCKDRISSADSEERFGQHLGQVFVAGINPILIGQPPAEQLTEAMEIISGSMNVGYTKEFTGDAIRFDLHECPIHKAANEPGYALRLTVAHLGFVALCESVLATLAPDWELIHPAERESDVPIEKLVFSRRTRGSA
jgi:hypothetical protein